MTTPSEVISKFLYDSTSLPSDYLSEDLIRANGDTVTGGTITIDSDDFLSNGAGRFAVPAQFSVVQNFFERSEHQVGLNSTGYIY